MNFFKILKRLKKIQIIAEIEEIYSDVTNNKKNRKKEFAFFNISNFYIFPTEILNEIVNKDNKKYLIVYGSYLINKKNTINCKFNDGKIHCVYAGTFDKRKGGAINAIDVAKYLNDKYVIHILGFGNEDEINFVIDRIKYINKYSLCKVEYNGLLNGKELIKFLNKCDIGLSTQIPYGEYNNSSFPSKLLLYMKNNLQIVTVRIPVIERSKLNKYVNYYDNVVDMANVIFAIDLNNNNLSVDAIKKLDIEFRNEMNQLINMMNWRLK